jgi:methyl-accepting chemotaxis protein
MKNTADTLYDPSFIAAEEPAPAVQRQNTRTLRFRSLNYQLVLLLLLTGLAGLLGGGVISGVLVNRYLQQSFADDSARMAQFVEVVARQPVFSFDFAQMTELASAVTRLPSITKMVISDPTDKMLAEHSRVATGATYEQKIELKQNDALIGYLHLTFDPSGITAQRNHLLMLLGSILIGVLMLVSAMLFFTLRRVVVNPINQVAVSLSDIASGAGDLTYRLPEHRRDEIGTLSRSFNRTMATLASLVRELTQIGHAVQQAATQLAQKAEQSQRNVGSQLLEVDQIATALHEMSASADEVANHAEQTLHASQQASLAAREGSTSVADNAATIHTIGREMAATSTQIMTLNEHSNTIGSVVTVIRAIAGQTNLLALNAAIEAARAGEHGRGFAVVADEVRTLAQKTQQSTHEIEQMVEALQQSTGSVHVAMQENQQSAIQATEATGRIEATLDTLAAQIQTINDMNVQVTSAAHQQSEVTTQISRHVTSMQDLSREVSVHSQSVATMAHQMQQQSETLIETLQQFRI